MEDQPPPYESAEAEYQVESKKTDRSVQRWSLAEQVTVSRSQQIAATVSRVQGLLEDRALRGMSKTTLLLVPNGQIDFSKGHEIVDAEELKYVVVELTSEVDSIEFWSQDEVVEDLRGRIVECVGGSNSQRQSVVRTDVRLREIYVRSESSFGLITTDMVKGLVISVSA